MRPPYQTVHNHVSSQVLELLEREVDADLFTPQQIEYPQLLRRLNKVRGVVVVDEGFPVARRVEKLLLTCCLPWVCVEMRWAGGGGL